MNKYVHCSRSSLTRAQQILIEHLIKNHGFNKQRICISVRSTDQHREREDLRVPLVLVHDPHLPHRFRYENEWGYTGYPVFWSVPVSFIWLCALDNYYYLCPCLILVHDSNLILHKMIKIIPVSVLVSGSIIRIMHSMCKIFKVSCIALVLYNKAKESTSFYANSKI